MRNQVRYKGKWAISHSPCTGRYPPPYMALGKPDPRRITLFISHSHAGDGHLCGLLEHELRRHGVDPWYSHGAEGISPGQDWEHRLRHEIARCDVFVILASEHLHRSRWCHREAQYASQLGKHLLVVRIDGHATPGWVDFLAGGRQHLSLERSSLQQVAQELAELCEAAMDGHLNPGEDELQSIEIPFEVAARGHVHQAIIRRGGTSNLVQVDVPPCGRNQTVRKHLGGESHLTLIVRVLPTDRFMLLPDGLNVLVGVAVDLEQLEAAGRMEIPTLDGPRQIEVPPHLQHAGARISLKGAGVGRRGSSKGDLIVELRTPARSRDPRHLAEISVLHRRLGILARVFVFASPLMLGLVASTGISGMPATSMTLIALFGYSLGVGGWLGTLSLTQRSGAVADWVAGVAAALCGLPVLGPTLLFWCGWEIELTNGHDAFRRALTSHAVLACAAWLLHLTLPSEAPDWVRRILVTAAVLSAGYFLMRSWRLVIESEARRPQEPSGVQEAERRK